MLNFTEQQKTVFDFISNGQGNGMINAVAGAGKTTTLLEAARYIPEGEEVLFCAFNKSVSFEISQRARLCGLQNIQVRTIHSLGWNIINEMKCKSSTVEVKYQNIIHSQMPLVTSALDNALSAANVPPRSHVEYYQHNQGALISLTPAQRDKLVISGKLYSSFCDILLLCVDRVRQSLTENNESAFRTMVKHFGIFKDIETSIPNLNAVIEVLREITFKIIDIGILVAEYQHVIDFNDMIYLPHKWNLCPIGKYSYCFVDECQDLTRGQVEIIKKYLTPNARVLAVGDPFQSICGFTGADTKSYRNMKKILSAKEFPLSGSFRCAQTIINEAQTIRPIITGIRTEKGIVEHLNFEEALNKVSAGDMVIARQRDVLVRFALRLVEKDIPIRFNINEFPRVLSEMKGLFFPSDIKEDFSIRGEFLLNKAKQRGYSEAERRYRKVHNQEEKALLIGAYRSKIDMYTDFISHNWNKWGGNSLYMFFYRLEEKLQGQFQSEYVQLYTIYYAKGLEADRVYVLDYDNMPIEKNNYAVWEKEQEVNLKYVAVTRSKNELFLVAPLSQAKWEAQLSLF